VNDDDIIPWGIGSDFVADDSIDAKPIPRWPHRASYRAQVRNARRRRNIQKREGAK
jgi:hypothetical protein